MNKNRGFTLIELVIVIIVLGILAATALPKFVNLSTDARKASLQGLKGAISSAANIVYSKAAIEGTQALKDTPITINGAEMYTAYGYPNVGGGNGDGNAFSTTDIGLWLSVDISYNNSASSDWYMEIPSALIITFYPQDYSLFDKDGDGDATECNVTYMDALAAGDTPTITVFSDDC